MEERAQSRTFCGTGVWLLVACTFVVEQCGKIPQGHRVRASYAHLSTQVGFYIWARTLAHLPRWALLSKDGIPGLGLLLSRIGPFPQSKSW